MILEDMPMDAELIEYELARARVPFVARCADSRDAFLRELAEFRPDVILCDYTLPQFDGMAALALARERAPATPLLIVTGSVNEETAVRCMKAGAADYLLKGNLARIGPAVEAALARARARIEQARAEAALRRSEANLSAIFNNSLQCFALVDRDGTIQALNRTAQEWAARIAGHTPREGERIADFIPEAAPHLADALGGNSRTLELSIRDADGVLRWFETSAVPVVDDQGTVIGVCLSAVNIDERRRAADAVATSERRFRSLVQNSSDLVTVVADDGTIVYASDSSGRIIGQPPEALVGTSLLARLSEAEAGALRRLLQSPATGSSTGPVQVTLPHADGRPVCLEAVATDLRHDPVIGGIVVTARDVSERARAERALRESEERYRDLFDNASDLVCMAAPDGAFLYVNKAWQAATGYTDAELTRLQLVDIVQPDQRTRFADAFGRVLAGETVGHLDVVFLTKSGAPITLEGSVSCTVKDGAPAMVRGIFRDVTERKRVEEQLRRAERMQAAGRLAGGVAHEVNNMMTGVIGFGSFLLRGLEPEDPRRAEVQEILKAATRAADVTRQLLAFTRQQFRRPEVLDVNAVIAGLDRLLRRSAGDENELRIRPARDLIQVNADRGQLEQVLVNLVLNARDSISGRGRITIETSAAVLDAEYARRHSGVTIPCGPYVMIAVSDTGSGMTPEVQARIFEPFFTTKPVGQGTGLGLSTVYGIVKQSDGFVWAYSEPGQGTVFKVYLPRVQAGAVAAVEGPSASMPVGGRETILVVEDEEVVRLMTSRGLREHGYHVVEARHGAEGVGYIKAHPGEVDLVISDVVMPEMGGRELGQQIAALDAGVPVLYMSGYTGDDVVQRGLLDPGAPFQQKPFTPDALARRVRELLDARAAAPHRPRQPPALPSLAG